MDNNTHSNEHVKYLAGHTAYARWLYEVGHNPVGWVIPRIHEYCSGAKCGCQKAVSIFKGRPCFVEMPAFSTRYHVLAVEPARVLWLNHAKAREAKQQFEIA